MEPWLIVSNVPLNRAMNANIHSAFGSSNWFSLVKFGLLSRATSSIVVSSLMKMFTSSVLTIGDLSHAIQPSGLCELQFELGRDTVIFSRFDELSLDVCL